MPINLKKQEEMMRAGHARALVEAAQLGPSVQCQVRGFEVELAAALWVASERNAETDQCMVSAALGNVIGSILRNYLTSTCGTDTDKEGHHAKHFFDGLTQTFNHGQSVEDAIAAKHGLN